MRSLRPAFFLALVGAISIRSRFGSDVYAGHFVVHELGIPIRDQRPNACNDRDAKGSIIFKNRSSCQYQNRLGDRILHLLDLHSKREAPFHIHRARINADTNGEGGRATDRIIAEVEPVVEIVDNIGQAMAQYRKPRSRRDTVPFFGGRRC